MNTTTVLAEMPATANPVRRAMMARIHRTQNKIPIGTVHPFLRARCDSLNFFRMTPSFEDVSHAGQCLGL